MRYKKYLAILIIVSFIIRCFLSAFVEFGNDEVNYWTYALYPDLSHFDHPPMVGYFIQLFTLNLTFQSEFFVRLASIVTGTINTYLIYLIAKKIRDDRAGLFAASLYTASFYCTVICGIFIMPDTPLSLFWLGGIYLLIEPLTDDEYSRKNKTKLLMAGICIGFGMLSKYTAVFLWAGAFSYLIIFNRKLFKVKELYLSVIISFLFLIPVIIWNYQNDFISFKFQGERADIFNSGLRFDYFATELAGQIFYNNPINFFTIITSLFLLRNKDIFPERKKVKLLLLWSLPVLVFLVISLFNKTLPHWASPGYFSLFIISGIVLADKFKLEKIEYLYPRGIVISLFVAFLVVAIGYLEINYGIIPLKDNDITLDMYGWRKLNNGFVEIVKNDKQKGLMNGNAPIITFRWFPAGHLDYYVARNNGKYVIASGEMKDIRNYYFINKKRNGLKQGEDAYFIVSNRDYKNPEQLYGNYFTEIFKPDTIRILRSGGNVMEYYIFRLKSLKKSLPGLGHIN